jgi:drug/metabolite transporter (DMT)-like permease
MPGTGSCYTDDVPEQKSSMEERQTITPARPHTYTQLALPALLAGATAIGFAPIFVRLSQAGPSATAFWRLALALPVLYAFMAAGNAQKGPYRKPSTGLDYARLSLAGLFFAGDLAFWHWSIRFTTVANATLLANFAPIIVTLGAWLLFKQRARLGFALGMLVALSGTSLIVGSSLSFDPSRLLGDIFGLVTAVFYGAYLLAVSRLRAEFSTGTVMTWSGAVSCLALLPVALLFQEAFLPFDWRGWLVLLGLALVSHVGGQSLIAFRPGAPAGLLLFGDAAGTAGHGSRVRLADPARSPASLAGAGRGAGPGGHRLGEKGKLLPAGQGACEGRLISRFIRTFGYELRGDQVEHP